jgi:hypothetical protein
VGQNSATRPLRDRAELRRVLSAVLDRLGPDVSDFDYRLVGTGAALAQGVDVAAGDIDILVARRAEVDGFAAALSEFRCLKAPVWLPDARQYFTRFEVDGVEVEASTVEQPMDADTFECVGSGPWRHCLPIGFGRHLVPVVALELRLVTELVRDRPDRYLPLVDHMRSHGADVHLIQRAMSERGVDPTVRRQTLDRFLAPE